jgi:DNA-binding CsgD family transcriptional regulator
VKNWPVKEHRAEPQPEHSRVVAERAVPALFVLDRTLRVLHYREDPTERRMDCAYQTGSRRLPPLIQRAVQSLLETAKDQKPGTRALTAVPNGSVLVRILPLDGSTTAAYAVLVERFKMRGNLRAVAARYALSKREHEALALVVKGARNSEIASRLQISHSTAIFHVKRLMAKTGARNRAELVAKVVG